MTRPHVGPAPSPLTRRRSLHHVMVVGGTVAEWAEMRLERLGEAGRRARQLLRLDRGAVADGHGCTATTDAPNTASRPPAWRHDVGGCCGHRRSARRRPSAVRRGDESRSTRRPRSPRRRSMPLCTAPPMSEPDLLVVLGPPTQLPPSLVWELAYAELVFIPVAWSRLRRRRARCCGGRLRRPSPPVRWTRRRMSSHERRAVPGRGGRAAHVQARRVRPDRGDHDRRARQGARRRQGRAQDEVEVRRPARADEPCAAVALPRPRARHRQPGRLDRAVVADAVDASTGPRRGWPRSRPSTSWRSNASPIRASTEWRSVCCARSPQRPSPLNVSAFYWKLLAAEGLEPQLDACVRCGESVPTWRSCRSTSTRAACSAANCAPARRSRRRRWRSCATSSAAGSTKPWRSRSRRPRTKSATLATRALEHHIERRLRAVAMFEARTSPPHQGSRSQRCCYPVAKTTDAVALATYAGNRARPNRQPVQAPRVRLPVGRDLRRVPVELRLRAARFACCCATSARRGSARWSSSVTTSC